MRYINIYEIAEAIKFPDLDKNNFKKFKRRLSAELELDNDEIVIGNNIYSKFEINEIIDSIEKDKNLLEIYSNLYKNRILHKILQNNYGSFGIKHLQKILSIEDEKTISFISPYLINIYSKSYKESFLNNDIEILLLPPPLSEKYYDQIYEPLYRIIKNKEKELLNLKDKSFDFYQVKKF